jgi:hypothetical protein
MKLKKKWSRTKKITIKRIKIKSEIQIKWDKLLRNAIKNEFNKENDYKKKSINQNNMDQIWQIKKN